MKLKLFCDNKSSKVLFAEADKEFVDFLFGILALPLGTATMLLACLGLYVLCIRALKASVTRTLSLMAPKSPCCVTKRITTKLLTMFTSGRVPLPMISIREVLEAWENNERPKNKSSGRNKRDDKNPCQ
ncbi:hypothetical protein QQ045_016360 [Rhodiola kirilowii]